jgi:hypothetical protein
VAVGYYSALNKMQVYADLATVKVDNLEEAKALLQPAATRHGPFCLVSPVNPVKPVIRLQRGHTYIFHENSLTFLFDFHDESAITKRRSYALPVSPSLDTQTVKTPRAHCLQPSGPAIRLLTDTSLV